MINWFKKWFHKWVYTSGGKYDTEYYKRYRQCSKCKTKEYYDDYLGDYWPVDLALQYKWRSGRLLCKDLSLLNRGKNE